MSTFTDCPGREKLAYPADYVQPFGSVHRTFRYPAYLRTMERHLAEGRQSRAGEDIGNVALKAPVYDWGYTGRFGDEINWVNGIVLVPWPLYETYGDTGTMSRYYPQMQAFLHYIRTRKAGTGADACIVDAALADWIASENTSGRITGPGATTRSPTGRPGWRPCSGATPTRPSAAASPPPSRTPSTTPSTTRRSAGTPPTRAGATQDAQALALDEGLVPEGERERVLDALVELVHAHQPFGGGPHLSGGAIGLDIRQAPDAAGYRELVIDPRPVGGLTRAEGSYHTSYGVVSARWLREKGRFRLDVELPPNTTAQVRVPTGGRKAQVTGDARCSRAYGVTVPPTAWPRGSTGSSSTTAKGDDAGDVLSAGQNVPRTVCRSGVRRCAASARTC
ncbi:alpha-L-rhamnosidase C-terminal domain-containing protein [Streptomyces paradoxus]|uniref:alpha-L-rhamnosidase-related protein n=1 Tax=Streptomyces paradoxus TaxID=66375 RepID=UPI00363F87C7